VDAFVLPGIAISIVGFLAYVWFAWLQDPANRSLRTKADGENEDTHD
jgi:hypothetical protein